MDRNVPRYVRRALDTRYDHHTPSFEGMGTGHDRTRDTQYPWFAVTTQTGQEFLVRRQFAVQGLLHLLPLWRPQRTWRNCLRRRLEPVFCGFIFVSCTPHMLQYVRHMAGVQRIVGDYDLPLPVDPETMAALQVIVAHRLSYWPHLPQYTGWRGRVTQGVLAGVRGRFCIHSRPAHLVINVGLIQRALAVEVPPQNVEILWTIPQGRNAKTTQPTYE